ncbi:MAG: outer membrane beta-barrel protein [bacterium]
MRKILATTFVVILMCVGASAADLDIGTHASFYYPPEGGGNTLMTGIDATYRIGPYLSIRGDLDNSSYQAAAHKYSMTSLAVTLIGHLLGASMVDPYLGGGVGLYEKNTDGTVDSSTGLNALAGIAIRFQTFNVGVEAKYVLPDTRHMETGFYTIGGNMTGGLHIDL